MCLPILLALMLLLIFSLSQFNLIPINSDIYYVNADTFNFAAVGDWSNNSQTDIMAQNMDSKNPEIVLGLGDYAYEENLDDIRLWWDQMKMIHDDEIFVGALGTHDSDNEGDDGDIQDEDYYLDLFRQNSNQSSWTYSFTHNGVLFVAINTEEEETNREEQREQVRDMLNGSSNNVDWKVVFFHKPILTSETRHGVEDVFDIEYCQIFEENGVNLILQAHNHNYQRSSVLDCRDDGFVRSVDGNGFTIATVGTGGRDPYELRGQSPMIIRQFEDRFGFLNVDIVNNTQMKAQFIDNENSKVADSFTINKGVTTKEDTSNSSEMC
jgi:hypothetical protein